MRNVYVISYDVVDDKRRTKLYKQLLGYGDHLQFSVFRCELSLMRLKELEEEMRECIAHDADQILVVDLGPADGRAADCVRSIGRSYAPPERSVIVI